MSRIITEQEQREFITGHLHLIETAIHTARAHMTGGAGCRPEIVDLMFELIQSQAERAQEFKWPDPFAKMAQAARQDLALQKLLKRAAKRTPIRASASYRESRALKGSKTGEPGHE